RIDGSRSVSAFFTTQRREGRWGMPDRLIATAVSGTIVLDLREALLQGLHTIVHATLIRGQVPVVVPQGGSVAVRDGPAPGRGGTGSLAARGPRCQARHWSRCARLRWPGGCGCTRHARPGADSAGPGGGAADAPCTGITARPARTIGPQTRTARRPGVSAGPAGGMRRRVDDDRGVPEDPVVAGGVGGKTREVRTLPEPVDDDVQDTVPTTHADGLAGGRD